MFVFLSHKGNLNVERYFEEKPHYQQVGTFDVFRLPINLDTSVADINKNISGLLLEKEQTRPKSVTPPRLINAGGLFVLFFVVAVVYVS